MMDFRVSATEEKSGVARSAEPRSDVIIHYDRDRSIPSIVAQHAAASPKSVALVCEGRTITYDELERVSDRLAAYLIREGVQKGDIVCLFVPRSPEAIVAMLAILKAGAAYLPLDTTFPIEHLDYVIGECEPKVVFVDPETARTIRSVPNAKGSNVDLFALLQKLTGGADEIRPDIAVGGGDLAYVMFTSGSTGRPKGVAIAHRGIARLSLDQNYLKLTSNDVMLHAATIAFDASTFEVWCALTNGCKLAILPDGNFSVARLRDVVGGNGVTVALLTTGLFNLLADYPGSALPSLRHMFFGGEVASVEHVRRFQKTFPDCRVTNAYGPTEITVLATAYDIPAGFDGSDVPIGQAVEHTGILIVDEERRPVPAGVEGELVLTGDGVAIGYFKRPELTAERFVTIETPEAPLRGYLTGDLAVLDENGSARFKGRVDRQIKLNGKRIELDEIEAALRRDPRLSDGVVICQTLGPQNKRILGYICPQASATADDAELIRGVMERLRNALPAYMIPSVVTVLRQLPLHQSGKVDRSKLPLPVNAAPTATAPITSQTEAVLLGLWQAVLGIQAVELDRNFFDLGGTSLQLMRIHAALESNLGRPVDVVALFEHPTIRELAGFLDGRAIAGARAMSAAERAALQRKTMSQFRRSAP
ncbi:MULTISPECIES: non-ribosomal peptide synthetase [Sinorhizobium]|nr:MULTISPECIES: non-ribosomal peptide synthetase [Sinorhizobium]ASY59906.1 Non-ribosomal peptide synthetase [Sinorhizobium sp. CCBAU 05631]